MTNCSSSGGRSDENDVLDFNRSRCVGVDRRRVDQEAVSDLLESCNDGPSKAAIVEFVGRVTAVGGPDYVPQEQRIATFDNDGTLWSEQPLYPVPQNAPCVSAGMNPVRSHPQPRPQSYGVNVLKLPAREVPQSHGCKSVVRGLLPARVRYRSRQGGCAKSSGMEKSRAF